MISQKQETKWQAYKVINLVVLMYICYLLILPIISPFLSKIMPTFWRCQYLAYTGHPCPFCGMTRDFAHMFHFNFANINAMSLFFLIFVLFEFIFRIVLLSVKNISSKVRIFDIVIHIIFVIVIIVYIIAFFMMG